MRSSKILWKLLTTTQLQKDNLPAPVRIPPRLRYRLTYRQRHCQPKNGYVTPTQKPTAHSRDSNANYRSFISIGCCMSRKRRAGSLDKGSCDSKIRKQCASQRLNVRCCPLHGDLSMIVSIASHSAPWDLLFVGLHLICVRRRLLGRVMLRYRITTSSLSFS
jgi:hypothetical protein